MPQKKAWEKEYDSLKLMTLGAEPQADVLRFLKWYKKFAKTNLVNEKILDLGCGAGRNANYLASEGALVIGMDIARNVLDEARRRAKKLDVAVKYIEQSIGAEWPMEDGSADLILDVTSSNSLNEDERETYLRECDRVLQRDGILFFRGLCRDGDKNAKELLKTCPGTEYDTYKLKGVGIVERVFSEADLRSTYGRYFKFLHLEKKIGYQRFNNQSYKRIYWLAYLQKK
jgi:SAM-dependent methyltransferase